MVVACRATQSTTISLQDRAAPGAEITLGSPWLESAERDITSLGSQTVIGLVVTASLVTLG